MLTRLRVKGFKNLVDTEVHFGPFTCIAGANAVGKSNLFDAIRFLSLLANGKLDEAGRSIRAEGAKNADVRSLFTRHSKDQEAIMEFDLDMIVPPTATDDLGQSARAAITFLNYSLSLRYRTNVEARRQLGELEILREELKPVPKTEVKCRIAFPCSREWLHSVLHGTRTQSLISTVEDDEPGRALVRLHQDGEYLEKTFKKQRYIKRPAAQMPRTYCSVADADSPTMLCARAEMSSWEMVHLEPGAMREGDPLHHPPGINSSGGHLPSTLFELGRTSLVPGAKPDPEAAYQRVGNKLAELLGDAGTVRVDQDDKRELLTIQLVDRWGTVTPARSLSDGTLCFIALILKKLETSPRNLLCMEEPENGIHPRRIPAMLELLQDIAINPLLPVDESNPLRQVIINTHSPVVVQQVPEESLLVAEAHPWRVEAGSVGSRFTTSALQGTWRTEKSVGCKATTKGSLLAYLRPVATKRETSPEGGGTRVIDREDMQLLLKL